MDLERVRDLITRGRYFTGLRMAAEAAESAAGARRAELLILAARAAQQLGLTRETAQLAGGALAAAGGDPQIRARALAAAGSAALDLGDPAQAEEYLLEAAGLTSTPAVAAAIQYHLGCAYERMRRPGLAMTGYQRTAQLASEAGLVRREIQARHNLAWLLLEQGETVPARHELSRVQALLDPESPFQAQQLALEAFAARVSGQGAEAVRICEDLLAPGHPGATAWCRCYAAWLAGDVAADEGRTDLARQFLDRARREAEGARDPALWNRLAALQGRLDDK